MLHDEIYLNKTQLIQESLKGDAKLGLNGQVCVFTGEYTGRAAQDKYIVARTELKDVGFGEAGKPMSPETFSHLYAFFYAYSQHKCDKLYVKDFVSGSLKARLITDKPSHALFVTNMFKTVNKTHYEVDLTIYAITNCKVPSKFKLNSSTIIAMDLVEGVVLIGGTNYAGEIKKSVFTYLSYKFPEDGVLPMHSSVTTDNNGGNAAVFFGLSGTGKTTLSADPNRKLLGDDEHGWSDDGLFNFEAGCYAKLIRLSHEKEPMIWKASNSFGAILENVVMNDDCSLNFDSTLYTENTRGAYPLSFIPNAHDVGYVASHPKNIIMLTCDAYGVLPSVSKLSPETGAYHFISGYTAKVAGTESGVSEPKATFSALFGAPFMPKHISVYVDLFLEKLKLHKPNVWLVNTGWFGGGPGVGSRIELNKTRMIIQSIVDGVLQRAELEKNETFNLYVPKGVPHTEPHKDWTSQEEYNKTAKQLVNKFHENMLKFDVPEDVMFAGMPLTTVSI